MPTPQSKSDLLKLIQNPLARELFEEKAEQALRSPESTREFSAIANGFNQSLAMGLSCEDIFTHLILRETQPKKQVMMISDLNQHVELTDRQKALMQQIDCFQEFINNKTVIDEKFIAHFIKTLPQIDINRLHFAIENVKTQASPLPLVDKISASLHKSATALNQLESLLAYMQVANHDNRNQFSRDTVAAITTQINRLTPIKDEMQTLNHIQERAKKLGPHATQVKTKAKDTRPIEIDDSQQVNIKMKR